MLSLIPTFNTERTGAFSWNFALVIIIYFFFKMNALVYKPTPIDLNRLYHEMEWLNIDILR